MNVIKKLAGQTAIYGLSTIIGRFLNFLLVPLYTRFFSQAEYGIVTELYSYTVFLMILLTYGMETGFFRFSQDKKDSPHVYTTILSSLFTSSTLFIILVYIFLSPISQGLGYVGYEKYIFYMALIIGIDAFTTIPFAKLRHNNKAIRFATIKLITIAVNIGLNILFIVILPKIAKTTESQWIIKHFQEADIGYIFVSNLIASVLTLILLLPDVIQSHTTFKFDLLRRILSYSWPLLIAGFAGSINEVFDRISLRYFLTIPQGEDSTQYILSQIGIYGANYKLAMIISMFNQAFRFAAEPFFFSRMHAADSRQTYANIMNYFIGFTLLVFLVITLYLDAFKHFIGSNFHDGLSIVPILLIANIFLGIVFNLSIWYKLSNQTKFGIWIIGFGALITLLINILFVPHFGYIACAWATLACYVLMAILSYYLCQKHYGIPYRIKDIALYFLIVGILYIINTSISVSNITVMYSIKTISVFAFIILFVLRERKVLILMKQKDEA